MFAKCYEVRNLKVHFIYPDVGTGFYPSVHHGLAQLFSVLEKEGHQVSLHHITREPDYSKFIETLLVEHPDIIGFTAMSNQIEYVKKWSKWIKFYSSNIPIICGGVHATLNPVETLGISGIDAVCVGDGERAIFGMMAGMKGIISKSLTENLDDLPYPNYDLFDNRQMLNARNGNFAVISSRGCPHNCFYCCNHALRNKQRGLGKYFRFRSVDNVLRQLEGLMAKYPIKSFSFADDIFGINKEWVYEFCEKYPQRIGLGFECNLRAETATSELLGTLKSANCTKVEMGIESGNSWMRYNVLNRKMSNQQIIDAFANAHKVGIKTRAYNMIGLPYETPDMVKETIALNKLVEPDQVAVFYFYPYKGTKLYDVCKAEGFISNRQSSSYVSSSILDLPTITHKQLSKLYNEFYRYVMAQEMRGYPLVLRYPLKAVGFVLRWLTGGNEVNLIRNGYMKMFGLFHYLRGVK